MIIKKTILNHNFVPMYLNSIENKILNDDKLTENKLWTIEYNDEPIFIKPYQTAEVLLSINTTQPEYKGLIYLDSIYHSDLYDTFGTITGWLIEFKRNYTMYNFHEEPVLVPYRPNNSPEIDIELSLFESGKMFKQTLDSFRLAGFDPEIQGVQVYRPWLYGVFQCCTVPPVTYEVYKWGTWSEGNPGQNILLPGKILKEGDDYIYQLRMNSNEVKAHIEAVRDLMESSDGRTCAKKTLQEQLRQVFSPYGLSVTLNLTPESDNPYIVQYNLFNSIVWLPYKESEAPLTNGQLDTEAPFLYDHTGNILVSQIGLIVIPNDINVTTHSDEEYSFEVTILLPYSSAEPVTIQDIQITPSDAHISLKDRKSVV